MNKQLQYGLEQQDIDNIVSILKQAVTVSSAILFGSRAMGTHRSGSDIDIILIGNSVTHQNLLDILITLDELNLPYKFDIIIHNKITEPALLEQINRVGKTLFSR